MKAKLTAVFTASLFIIAVLAISSADAKPAEQRYLIKSQKKELKNSLGVQHEFKNGFTANLSAKKSRELKAQGIELEAVPLYQPTGKPVCGDGKCQGNEPSSCPADCSAPPDPDPQPAPRACYPPEQMPYGINMVHGGSGGAGVKVAVLDTGVNTSHPDLNVSLCKDATKRGIKNGCSDSDGHGTHVSGTVAANGGADGLGIYGVAPEASLWMIKVCGPNGCWTDDMSAGIRYAADQGANIISMSIGGDTESPLVRDAIDYAVAKGVLIIAAAGNDGPELGSIDWPGANPNVVAVAAIDQNYNVADWSSRGLNDGDGIIEAQEVELSGPGVYVLSTYNNGCYAYMSGTSMATPHVAGLAAKVWQGSAAATRTYLHQIAVDLAQAGDDPATGFGLPVAP